MPYVVKFMDPVDVVGWLSEPDENGSRSFVERQDAAIFATLADAHFAIANSLHLFAESWITYDIEPAD